jgi:hypothetical protein
MSQPEMLADRLRAELAEVKRQRDELRKALVNLYFDPELPESRQMASAALKATEAKP